VDTLLSQCLGATQQPIRSNNVVLRWCSACLHVAVSSSAHTSFATETLSLEPVFLLPPPMKIMLLSWRYLSVCLFGTLRKILRTDLQEIFREGWQWANEQTIKFWWHSGSRSRIRIRMRIRIATLARRALAEVCTVPVLLVVVCFSYLHRYATTYDWSVNAGCTKTSDANVTVKLIFVGFNDFCPILVCSPKNVSRSKDLVHVRLPDSVTHKTKTWPATWSFKMPP